MITALIIIAIVIAVATAAVCIVLVSHIINIQMQLNDVKKDFNLRLNNMAEGNQILTKQVRECQELIERGFKVTNYTPDWIGLPAYYFRDYTPTSEERDLLIERITERITNSPKKCFHYYGRAISKEEAVEILKR